MIEKKDMKIFSNFQLFELRHIKTDLYNDEGLMNWLTVEHPSVLWLKPGIDKEFDKHVNAFYFFDTKMEFIMDRYPNRNIISKAFLLLFNEYLSNEMKKLLKNNNLMIPNFLYHKYLYNYFSKEEMNKIKELKILFYTDKWVLKKDNLINIKAHRLFDINYKDKIKNQKIKNLKI